MTFHKMPPSDARPANPVRIPCSQLVVRSPQMGDMYDPAVAPSRLRIRPIEGFDQVDSDELVAMATLVRAEGGGPLRTFSGGLAHENGWQPIHKAGRLLHWQGETHLGYLFYQDTRYETLKVATESLRVEYVRNGQRKSYTGDVEVSESDGSAGLVELKRDERDLADPEYRLDLAYVCEILRRCCISFKVVLSNEIFESRRHRLNVEDFASRAFRTTDPDAMRRFVGFALDHRETTYGDLASVIEPISQVQGRATIQALLVRRRVRIDLTQRLHDDTPVVTVLEDTVIGQ